MTTEAEKETQNHESRNEPEELKESIGKVEMYGDDYIRLTAKTNSRGRNGPKGRVLATHKEFLKKNNYAPSVHFINLTIDQAIELGNMLVNGAEVARKLEETATGGP